MNEPEDELDEFTEITKDNKEVTVQEEVKRRLAVVWGIHLQIDDGVTDVNDNV